MYDPFVGQFLSEDYLGLLDDVHPRRYVKNDPINYTDPTGMYSEPLRDDRIRNRLLDSATTSLRSLVNQGRITQADLELRVAVVSRALNSKWNLGEHRDPEFWDDTIDPEGAYVVRRGKDPFFAIDRCYESRPGAKNATEERMFGTGCRKGALTHILAGAGDYLRNLDQKLVRAGNGASATHLKSFNAFIGHEKPPTDEIETFAKIDDKPENRRFESDDIAPGDVVWMQNPFSPGGKSNVDDGTHAVFLGEGLYVGWAGMYVYDKDGLQRYVEGSCVGAKGKPLDSFQIQRVYRPQIPKFSR